MKILRTKPYVVHVHASCLDICLYMNIENNCRLRGVTPFLKPCHIYLCKDGAGRSFQHV